MKRIYARKQPKSDFERFVDDHVDEIVCEVNDDDWQHELWGQDFRDECARKMFDLLEENGMDGRELDPDYVYDAFDGYGEGNEDIFFSTNINAAAGRSPGRMYRSIKFGNWSSPAREIKEYCEAVLSGKYGKVTKDDLIRNVRYSISEAENVEAKMIEYRKILERFNSSAKTNADVQRLLNSLENFKFSQD